MQTQIRSYKKEDGKLIPLCLFGYLTRGIPGLEIKGFGSHGRIIKEKLIFIIRSRKIKLPPRRYVICLDKEDTSFTNSEIRNLEFPIYLILLYLSRNLPISRLDDCVSWGRLTPQGIIKGNSLDRDLVNQYNDIFNCEKLIIKDTDLLERVIPSNLLLKGMNHQWE